MDYQRDEGAWVKYARSKAGNVLHAVEFARQARDDGIVSVVSYPVWEVFIKTPVHC